MSMTSNDTRALRIGLLGAGVVGGGVIELLEARGRELNLELVRVAVKDQNKARPEIRAGIPVGTVDEVLTDPNVDVVVEVMGGLDPALRAVKTALECGKDVVTANKVLVAHHKEELRRAASGRGARIRFEASVAGCLPIVEIIQAGLIFDKVERLFGILNGTTNFILTRGQRDGVAYPAALAEAQRAGFAEADPTLDVSGVDTAQKLAILVGLITGQAVSVKAISIEGIEALSLEDHRAAEEIGCRLKLLASYVRSGSSAHLRVAPTLVPSKSALGLTTDEYNAVEVECTHIGWQLHLGKGAGRMPTASAVLHDLISLRAERNIERRAQPSGSERSGLESALECLPPQAWPAGWLVRMPGDNPHWPVSRISASFAAHCVEIVEYRRCSKPGVGALIVSAVTPRGSIEAVARDIAALPGAIRPPVVLALEPDA